MLLKIRQRNNSGIEASMTFTESWKMNVGFVKIDLNRMQSINPLTSLHMLLDTISFKEKKKRQINPVPNYTYIQKI